MQTKTTIRSNLTTAKMAGFVFLMLLKMLRNWNPCILSVGIQNAATVENSKEVSQNIKKYNCHMTYHALSGYLPERIEIRVLKRY